MAWDWFAPVSDGDFGVVAAFCEGECFAFGFGDFVELFDEISPLHNYILPP